MPHADSTNFPPFLPRSELYSLVYAHAVSLLDSQTDWVSNTANISSLLHHAFLSIPLDVNWTGFYVRRSRDSEWLQLGPFQGKVACQQIQLGRGVCGKAALNEETIVVDDVEEWPGHIACDSESRSEIVVPIRDVQGRVRGVLDVDCRTVRGFSDVDREGLERIATLLGEGSFWPGDET